jgi:hypothetical protein
MRALAILALVLTATPAIAQDIELPPGSELETRLDADLNGDGVNDLAYIAHNEDSRALGVRLSVKHEFDVEFVPEVLILELTPLGPGSLSLDGNVLVFEDLTGGTTAIASTRRFRYDGTRKQMR